MKRLMMVAALAVAQSGCVSSQEDAPVLFSSALAVEGLPGECEPDTSKFIGQGSLDLAGGGNYLIAMSVRSTIPIGRAVIIGDTPTTVGGSSVTLTEFVYRYESSTALGLPAEESVATYFVVPAGSVDGYVFVHAFGPQALAKLKEAAPAKPGVGVISYIRARGRVGSTSNVESNEFSFPVSVFSTPGCSPATANFGICSPGQDVPTACVAAAPTTP